MPGSEGFRSREICSPHSWLTRMTKERRVFRWFFEKGQTFTMPAGGGAGSERGTWLGALVVGGWDAWVSLLADVIEAADLRMALTKSVTEVFSTRLKNCKKLLLSLPSLLDLTEPSCSCFVGGGCHDLRKQAWCIIVLIRVRLHLLPVELVLDLWYFYVMSLVCIMCICTTTMVAAFLP